MKRLLYFLAFCLGAFSVTALAQEKNPITPLDKMVEVSQVVVKADSLLARKDYDAALVEYRRALVLNANDPANYNKLGICYQRMGHAKAAQKAYEQTVKHNPQFAAGWNNLGTVFYSRHRNKQAVKSYRKALELKPDMAAAHFNLGTAYMDLHKYDEGFKAYVKAFELDPEIIGRQSNSGVIAKTTGQNSAIQYFLFAKLYAANGRLDEALAYLKKAQEAGFKDFDKVVKDPDFKGLVQDERFLQITEGQTA